MSEKSNAALTVGFFALILLILVAADVITGDRIFSSNENRVLAKRPKISAETILDGSYMEDYEAYVTDQFVGRDTWVELKTRGDILLQKKDINGVYLGKDDYLIERHSPEDISQKDVDKKIALLKDLVETYGAKAMLIPTADNVLTDKLPMWAGYYDQEAFLTQVEEAVGEENVINVLDTLREHSDEYIYYRTDHHWTSLGAYYGYLAWKDQTGAVAAETFDPSGLTAVTEEFLGTLHSKLNLPFPEDTIQIFPETMKKRPKVTYDFSKVTDSYYESKHLDTKNKYGYFMDDNHPFIEIDTGYRNGKELILIKNSFANCLVPLMANHYEKIYMIDLRYINGRLPDLLAGYLTPETEMLVLYDCIHFIEDFNYFK